MANVFNRFIPCPKHNKEKLFFLFIVHIDLQNLTNIVNDMNETLKEAKAMLIQNDAGTDWKWAAGSQHVELMDIE